MSHCLMNQWTTNKSVFYGVSITLSLRGYGCQIPIYQLCQLKSWSTSQNHAVMEPNMWVTVKEKEIYHLPLIIVFLEIWKAFIPRLPQWVGLLSPNGKDGKDVTSPLFGSFTSKVLELNMFQRCVQQMDNLCFRLIFHSPIIAMATMGGNLCRVCMSYPKG